MGWIYEAWKVSTDGVLSILDRRERLWLGNAADVISWIGEGVCVKDVGRSVLICSPYIISENTPTLICTYIRVCVAQKIFPSGT